VSWFGVRAGAAFTATFTLLIAAEANNEVL